MKKDLTEKLLILLLERKADDLTKIIKELMILVKGNQHYSEAEGDYLIERHKIISIYVKLNDFLNNINQDINDLYGKE